MPSPSPTTVPDPLPPGPVPPPQITHLPKSANTGQRLRDALGGPSSFAGSGYGITLVLVSIILHRIPNVVHQPGRRPARRPPRGATLFETARTAVSKALTSPSTAYYLRLPSFFLLLRSWALFTIITLQTAQVWPEKVSVLPWVRWLGEWAGGAEMSTVCWQTYLSVCAALVCTEFANSLDRERRQRADGGLGSNLLTYSFLLHLYSSPATHQRTSTTSLGRPDVHTLFQLWLSLTELFWMQANQLTSTQRRNVLAPSTFCGVLGLSHFVYCLYTSPLMFPSFTFATHLMALAMTLFIGVTVALKALTHLFTLGYIPSPMFANCLPHEGLFPSWEDDFGVTLLRMGSACMEATQYVGLLNEVASVEEKPGGWIELSPGGVDLHQDGDGGFSNEITDIEVLELEPPQSSASIWHHEYARFCKITGRVILSMIKSSDYGLATTDMIEDAYHHRWWYGPRQWRFWTREAWREPSRFREEAATRRLQRYMDRQLGKREQTADRTPAGRTPSVQPSGEPLAIQWREILSGQVEVEDDEEDWEDDESSILSVSSIGSEDDTQGLYRDLVNDEEGQDDIQPVLLAHMTAADSTPLTRRRYAAILSPPRPVSGLADIIHDRRMATINMQRDDWDDDRRRSCVVCTVEPRDTILWPCRCLAICSDCRESLAARLGSKDNTCPCCRKKVDGYSRIYIP